MQRMKGRSRSAWRVSSSRTARTASTDQSALAKKWWKAWGSALVACASRGSDLRLVSAPGDQAEREVGELVELADIGKHGAVVRAIVVDEGHGGDWFPRLGHSAHSLQLDVVNVSPRSLYAQIDRSGSYGLRVGSSRL